MTTEQKIDQTDQNEEPPKKRRGRPFGAKTGSGKKKKKKKKAGPKDGPRTSRLKAYERETIRARLVQHFGLTRVEEAVKGIRNVGDLTPVYLQLRKEMDADISAEEQKITDYYVEIDKDYKKIGRPNSVFNWIELQYLCSICCTLDEIAGFFQVCKDTVKRKVFKEYGIRWAEYYEKYSQGAKVSLRRAQLRSALEGDVSMQRFLGINMLGQKNKLDFSGEVKVNSWVDLVQQLDDPEPRQIPKDEVIDVSPLTKKEEK